MFLQLPESLRKTKSSYSFHSSNRLFAFHMPNSLQNLYCLIFIKYLPAHEISFIEQKTDDTTSTRFLLKSFEIRLFSNLT